MSSEFRICISSPPDRKNLVAEIFLGDEQWAEINQENGDLEIEIYPKPNGQAWQFSMEEMLAIVRLAQQRLLAKKSIS